MAAFSHIVVNDTQRLVAYDEAILFTISAAGINLEAASGNGGIDKQGPHAQGVKNIIRQARDVLNPDQSVFRVPIGTVVAHIERREGDALILFFTGRDKKPEGGVWLYRTKPFMAAEEPLLAELAHGYGVGLSLLRGHRIPGITRDVRNMSWLKKAILAGLVLLAFLPVRLSVSAPAEIVARDSRVVSAPFEGLIEEVMVSPGEAVEEGQVLLRMEETALRGRMDMAQEALNTAQTTLARLRREALSNPEKRIEMTALQSDMAIKRLEYDYAAALLSRARIAAPRGGVAVFSDKNALLGKPAGTGDVLMQVANPAEKELLIRIPAGAMIRLSDQSSVRFHLNVAPLSGHDATIQTLGYQASADPDGLLTYKIRAALANDDADMRIGWKGTATIKGEWTVLSYAVLRRPLAALRRITGL